MMAGRMGKSDSVKNAVVHTSVHIGEANDLDGFGLAVDIKVEGVDADVLKAGHEVRPIVPLSLVLYLTFLRQACPYSRALQHGVVVNVSKA